MNFASLNLMLVLFVLFLLLLFRLFSLLKSFWLFLWRNIFLLRTPTTGAAFWPGNQIDTTLLFVVLCGIGIGGILIEQKFLFWGYVLFFLGIHCLIHFFHSKILLQTQIVLLMLLWSVQNIK